MDTYTVSAETYILHLTESKLSDINILKKASKMQLIRVYINCCSGIYSN